MTIEEHIKYSAFLPQTMAEKNLHGYTDSGISHNANDIMTVGYEAFRAVVGNLTTENSLLTFKLQSSTEKAACPHIYTTIFIHKQHLHNPAGLSKTARKPH